MSAARGLIRVVRAALPAALAACSAAVRPPEAAPEPSAAAAPAQPQPGPAPASPDASPKPKQPVAPAPTAYLLGLMPLEATGVTAWRAAHPTYDGRGVLIAILDSGVDPGVAGLGTTSTGQPKILDLRNFSREGDVALERVRADARDLIVLPGGLTLEGADRVRALAVDSQWYGGVLRELPFGTIALRLAQHEADDQQGLHHDDKGRGDDPQAVSLPKRELLVDDDASGWHRSRRQVPAIELAPVEHRHRRHFERGRHIARGRPAPEDLQREPGRVSPGALEAVQRPTHDAAAQR